MPKCKLPSNVCNSAKAFVQSIVVNTITSDSDFQFVSSNKAAIVKNVVNTTTSSGTSFATWHFRLGHPSVTAMKIVFRLCDFPNINKKIFNRFLQSQLHWKVS